MLSQFSQILSFFEAEICLARTVGTVILLVPSILQELRLQVDKCIHKTTLERTDSKQWLGLISDCPPCREMDEAEMRAARHNSHTHHHHHPHHHNSSWGPGLAGMHDGHHGHGHHRHGYPGFGGHARGPRGLWACCCKGRPQWGQLPSRSGVQGEGMNTV